jgi:hypothetical protein
MVVVARNPTEMVSAQSDMIEWATAKIAEKQEEATELKENYEIAVKNKWRSSTLKKHMQKALKKVEYYEKVKAALEAGYFIIPNMDLDVFAMRTTRKNPTKKGSTSQWTNREQATIANKMGEGHYVDPTPTEAMQTVKKRNDKGEIIKSGYYWADEFKDVMHPFQLAKPQVLDATGKAMARKIFDDIGILPKRAGGDPMVVGRIIHREGYNDHAISFLIAWFVDTRDFI